MLDWCDKYVKDEAAIFDIPHSKLPKQKYSLVKMIIEQRCFLNYILNIVIVYSFLNYYIPY